MHGRDHCPGGTDPIPCLPVPQVFRASQWDTQTTTGTGTDMEQVSFDKWSNPDTTVFAETLRDPGPSGPLLKVIGSKSGLYVASLYINCVQSFDASVAGLIDDEEGTWGPAGGEFTRKMRAGHNVGFNYVVTISRHYPTIDFEEGTHGAVQDFPSFSCYVGQDSGVARDFQCRFDVAYWSDNAGSTITSS
jgi:hypothetical protein